MLKRDGTYICQILYSNISSSLLALELSPTELGDRFFEVKRVDDFNSSLPFMDRDPRDRLKKDIQDCKTAVIKLYSSEIEWNSKTNCLLTLKRAKENIINVCGGSDMVVLVELLHSDTKKEDVNVALVEFVGVEEMNRAREMVLSSPTKMKYKFFIFIINI